jgi:hypothetical protein
MHGTPSGMAKVSCPVYQPSGCFPEESTKLKGESVLTLEHAEIVAASPRVITVNARNLFELFMTFLFRDTYWLPIDTESPRLL